jgi:hypothetical protein
MAHGRPPPLKVVLYGSLALIVAIVLATPLRMNIWARS